MKLFACVLVCFVAALAAQPASRAETERGSAKAETSARQLAGLQALVTEGHSPPRSVSAAAKRWKPNRAWLHDAMCVYRHENGGYGWHANTGNGYYGGMQFLASTWRRAGGSGYPHRWAAREQLYRAWRIYRLYRTSSRAGSWSEWGTARRCGLA